MNELRSEKHGQVLAAEDCGMVGEESPSRGHGTQDRARLRTEGCTGVPLGVVSAQMSSPPPDRKLL